MIYKFGRWVDNLDPFLNAIVVMIIILGMSILIAIPLVYFIEDSKENLDRKYEYFEVDNMRCVRINHKGERYVSCDWELK